MRCAQDSLLLDDLDNWKLISKFIDLHCFDWCRIKFYANVVQLIQNSFQGRDVSLCIIYDDPDMVQSEQGEK